MSRVGALVFNLAVVGGFVWLVFVGHPWMATLLLCALATPSNSTHPHGSEVNCTPESALPNPTSPESDS